MQEIIAMVVVAAILITALVVALRVWGPYAPPALALTIDTLQSRPEESAVIAGSLVRPLDPAFERVRPLALKRVRAARVQNAPPTYDDVCVADRHDNGPESVRWDDKAWMLERLDELCLPRARTYYLGVPASAEELWEVLRGCPPQFVIKPTHLSEGDGIVLYSGGASLRTGKPMSLLEAAQAGVRSLGARPREFENWALKQVKPQIIVEEYLEGTLEVKFTVVWGRVIFGKVISNIGLLRKNLGVMNRSGAWIPGRLTWYKSSSPFAGRLEDFGRLVGYAERASAGADYIRIDTYYCPRTRDGRVGELTIPPHGSLSGFPQLEAQVARILLMGHEARVIYQDFLKVPPPPRAAAAALRAPPAAARAPLLPIFEQYTPRTAFRAILRAHGFPGWSVADVLYDRSVVPHPAQVVFEDKVQTESFLSARGLPHPRLLKVYPPGVDPSRVIDDLGPLSTFVLKPAHMAQSRGVVLYDRGTDRYTAKSINKAQAVEKAMGAMRRGQNILTDASEGIHLAKPALVLEEMVDVDFDLKFYAVWGQPFAARVIYVGETALQNSGASARFGGVVYASGPPPAWISEQGWASLLRAVTRVAEGSDLLRVDLLATRSGDFCVGEVTVFTSPELLDHKDEEELVGRLLDGHILRLLQGSPTHTHTHTRRKKAR